MTNTWLYTSLLLTVMLLISCSKNEVSNIDISPNFIIDKRTCVAPNCVVNFDATGSVGASSFRWDFGDGHQGAGIVTSHNYERAGNYTVTLFAVNGSQTEIATDEITVTGRVSDPSGNVYPFRVLGDGKKWITRNLNYPISGSACYDNLPVNCDQYGRHYNWDLAREACKSLGVPWRLPTAEDYKQLASIYGYDPQVEQNGGNEWEQMQLDLYNALIDGGESGFDGQLGGLFTPSWPAQFKDFIGYYYAERINEQDVSFAYFEYQTDGKSRFIPSTNFASYNIYFFSVRCVCD